MPMRNWTDTRDLNASSERRRRELHALGWTDGRIAADVGVDRATIGQWRRTRGLAPNAKPIGDRRTDGRKFDLGERHRLVMMGLSDREVGRRQGCHWETVRAWRKRHELARNFANVAERKGQGDGRQYLPSLDAPIYGLEDLTLHGVIADSSWSSWLEEMGATVW